MWQQETKTNYKQNILYWPESVLCFELLAAHSTKPLNFKRQLKTNMISFRFRFDQFISSKFLLI